jgi:hypothetical protein
MKYGVGNYLIRGFNCIGSKVITKKADSQTHLGSIAEGEKMVEKGEIASFVVVRVQFNSATKDKGSWE